MIDLKSLYDKILNEDAVMAAGGGEVAGGGEIAAPSNIGDADIVKGGMTTDDVLGKDCDHHKHGYLGPGCFHVPSTVCKMKREIPSGKKKKNQKNEYAKGMTVIEEAELDRDTILAIHKVKELELRNFILKFFGDEISNAMYVQAIAYFPPTKSFFVKVIDAGQDFKKNLTKYINLDFQNGKFKTTDDLNIYSSSEIKKQYSGILHGIRCWIVWGGF